MMAYLERPSSQLFVPDAAAWLLALGMKNSILHRQDSLNVPLLSLCSFGVEEFSPSAVSTEAASPPDAFLCSGNDVHDDASRQQFGRKRGSTKLAAVSVLTNTFLGVTLLTTPWVCAEVGVPLFLVCLLAFAGICTFSMVLLIHIALRINRTDVSFKTLMELGYPNIPALHYLGDYIIVLKCIGIGCGSVIIIGDTLPEVLGGAPYWISEEGFRALVILMTTVCLTLPASLPKRIRSLRFTNYVSLMCLLYVISLVVAASFGDTSLVLPPSIPDTQPPSRETASSLISLLQILPVFVFMFTCVQNLLSLSNEMRSRTTDTLCKVVFISVAISFGMYAILGLAGVSALGVTVTSDLLKSLDASNIYVWFAKLFIALSVVFSFPLQCHPFRRSLWVLNMTRWSTLEEDTPPQVLRRRERTFLEYATFFYVFVTAGLALFVHDLGLVFQLIGVTGSVTLSFIVPSALYLQVTHSEPWTRLRLCALSLLIFSLVFVPSSLYAILVSNLHSTSTVSV